MAASRFVHVTDEEINEMKENTVPKNPNMRQILLTG